MEFSQFTDWGYNIIQNWDYWGLFLINAVSTATVLLLIPGYIFVFTFGAILNPFFVALFSAFGAVIGESVSYFLGKGGSYVLHVKHGKYFNKAKEYFEKRQGFLTIVVFGATPLPFDIVGMLAGSLNYDFKKFILAAFIGKFISLLVLAIAGFYGLGWVLDIFEFRI